MMNGVKVAGQIAFYYPATHQTLTVTILQLELDRSDRMVNAAFGSEAVGKPMKIALPNRLHRHQHRPLHDSIAQTRYTQGPQFLLVTRFTNFHTPRRSRTPRGQGHARGFREPSSVGNQSQESIELTFLVLR